MGPQKYNLFRGPGTLNLMLANQFKRIIRVKLRVFIPKVAISAGPHVTLFWNVLQ